MGFAFFTKESDEKLSKTEEDSSCPQQQIGVFLIEEAHRYDEDNGNGTGNRVEQIELSDRDIVYFFERFLHGLCLIEDEVVSEHHEGQKNSQDQFTHLNNTENLIS